MGTLGSSAKLHQGNAAGRFERFADRLEHCLGLRELVVDINHEDQVDAVCRQAGIRIGAQQEGDVLQLRLPGPLLKHVEHLLLDIDCIDAASCTGQSGQFQRIEPVAATHVANYLPWLDVEFLQQRLAVFFPLAGFSREPIGAAVVHRRGDLAAHVTGRRGRRISKQGCRRPKNEGCQQREGRSDGRLP